MKKILAYGLAAVMAVATVTVASSDAFAKPMWMYYPHPPMMMYPHPGNFYFGFRFGPQFGPYLYRHSHPYRVFHGGNPHVRWCLSHYRTYNPATNTYFIRKGVPAVCISPFSY